jgi:chromate transport protein ChrA
VTPTWLTSFGVGLVTALRFVTLPSFVVLVLISLAWKWKKKSWLPLWKLGLALLALTLVGTLVFALGWQNEAGRL